MRSLRGATRLLGEGAAFALAGNVTVERAGDGKLRCTCTTWDDAVVMLRGEALTLVNIERQVPLGAKAPADVVQTPRRHPRSREDDFEAAPGEGARGESRRPVPRDVPAGRCGSGPLRQGGSARFDLGPVRRRGRHPRSRED
jgi:hypothetical protein